MNIRLTVRRASELDGVEGYLRTDTAARVNEVIDRDDPRARDPAPEVHELSELSYGQAQATPG